MSRYYLCSISTINKICDTFYERCFFIDRTKSRECYYSDVGKFNLACSFLREVYPSSDGVKARTRCSMFLNYRQYQKLPHDKVTRTDSVLTFYFSFGEYSCRAASGAISVLCS